MYYIDTQICTFSHTINAHKFSLFNLCKVTNLACITIVLMGIYYVNAHKKGDHVIKIKKIDQLGFSLLGAIVACAIGFIAISALSMMLVNQQKELKRLQQKSELIDFKNELRNIFKSSNSSCQFNFVNQSFDPTLTGASSVPMATIQNGGTTLYLGTSTTAPQLTEMTNISNITGVTVQSIRLNNFHVPDPALPTEWYADLVISVSSDSYPFKPISIPIALSSVNAGSVRKITDCVSVADSTGLAGLCPSGQFLTGVKNGVIQCSAVQIGTNLSNTSSSYTISNPGPGCTGNYCRTADFGSCTGTYCITNGNSCLGDNCAACGPAASCVGTGCCTGSACTGCF